MTILITFAVLLLIAAIVQCLLFPSYPLVKILVGVFTAAFLVFGFMKLTETGQIGLPLLIVSGISFTACFVMMATRKGIEYLGIAATVGVLSLILFGINFLAVALS